MNAPALRRPECPICGASLRVAWTERDGSFEVCEGPNAHRWQLTSDGDGRVSIGQARVSFRDGKQLATGEKE